MHKSYYKNSYFSYLKKIICISNLIIDDLLCAEGNAEFYIYEFFFRKEVGKVSI